MFLKILGEESTYIFCFVYQSVSIPRIERICSVRVDFSLPIELQNEMFDFNYINLLSQSSKKKYLISFLSKITQGQRSQNQMISI